MAAWDLLGGPRPEATLGRGAGEERASAATEAAIRQREDELSAELKSSLMPSQVNDAPHVISDYCPPGGRTAQTSSGSAGLWWPHWGP